MIGVIFMSKENGPLMFINTVSSNIKESSHQKIFDSRMQKEQRKNKDSKLNYLEERKINNIIEMYQKNRPVLCNIICKDQERVGIPFKKDDSVLFIKTSEEDVEEIYLNDINDIIIIRF